MISVRKRLGDLVWKLAAVAVAYGIWLTVIEEKQTLRQLEIPVRFESLSTDLALAGDRPSSIVVRVRSAESVAKQLQPPDVEARIDLTGLGKGTHNIRLPPDSPAIVPTKPGIKVVEVFPSALRVQIENKATKDIPLRVAFAGEPLDGYEVAEFHVVPDHVRIVGPESAVEATSDASTREVALHELRESFEREVRLDVDNPDVQLLSEPLVALSVQIRERIVERMFERVAVVAANAKFEANLRPDESTITLRGPARLLDQLTEADLRAVVDLEGLEPNKKPYELELLVRFERQQLSERVEVAKLSNDRISVRVLNRKLPPVDRAAD